MKKAFTLTEILVAVTLTVIIIVSLWGVLIHGVKINLRARHKAVAYHIASQEMEILRATSFQELVINQQPTHQPPGGSFIGTVEGLINLPAGEGILTIEDYQTDIMKITIKVLWKEGVGQKMVQLVTLISKGGLNPP